MQLSYYEHVRSLFQIAQDATSKTDILPFEIFFTDHPEQPEPYFLLGLIFYRLSDFGRSIKLLKHAHELDPQCIVYVDALACVTTLVGQLAEGLYFAKLALTCHAHKQVPELHTDELSNYGQALLNVKPSVHFHNALIAFNKRDFITCDQECDKYISLYPQDIESYLLKIKANIALGEYTVAANLADTVIKIKKNSNCSELHLLKGQSLLKYGMIVDAISEFDLALSEPLPDEVKINHLAKMISSLKNTSLHYRSARQHLLDTYQAMLPIQRKKELKNDRADNKKLHIAYVTDAAYNTPLGLLLEHLLYNHDRNNFYISIYQANINEDNVTQRLQTLSDNWQRIHDLNPHVLKHIVGNENIDVLIDFIGPSETRPHITFSAHDSTVQLGWLNTPFAHPALNLDYYLCGPLGGNYASQKHAERDTIIQLSGGCYTTSLSAFITTSEHSNWAAKGTITFGLEISLEALKKEDVAIWQSILEQHPTGEIILLPTSPLTTDLQSRISQLLASTGLRERISISQACEDVRSLNTYLQRIDIFVSISAPSSPLLLLRCYEALVPVISYSPSPAMEDNISASINISAEYAQWNAYSLKDFNVCLEKISGSVSTLEEQRQALALTKETSILFQPRKYTRMIEATYKRILARSSRP